MKFAGVASVGDVIRAYDFKPMLGREDSYVEGKVVEVKNTANGYDAFKIITTKSVFAGEVDEGRIGKFTFVPHEVSFMEYDARIINLSK